MQTETTSLLAKRVIYLISAHTAIYVFYNYVHGKIDILYSLTDYTPVFLIFCFAPLAAALFLSTQSARQGAVVLLGILPAELIYNVYTRFTASKPISIQEPALIWKIGYEGSFGSVLILEVIAFWVALKLLLEIHKRMSQSSENPS